MSSPKGRLSHFPSTTTTLEPSKSRDLQSNLPDLGLGRLIHLMVIYTYKEVLNIRDLSCLLCLASLLLQLFRNSEARDAFASAIKQASDQMKVVIKNGAAPQDEVISWIISVCPYFIVKSFGPFNQAVLDTRGHRPNPSGDVQVTKAIEKAM